MIYIPCYNVLTLPDVSCYFRLDYLNAMSDQPVKAGDKVLFLMLNSEKSEHEDIKAEDILPIAVRGVDAGGTYAVMSGTSVAAPYVAGACCLLHERYAALTPRDAKRMIVASSRVLDGARVFKL